MSKEDEAQGGDSQAPGFADDLAKAFDELEAVEPETGDGQPQEETDAIAADEAATPESDGENTGDEPNSDTLEGASDGEQPEEGEEGEGTDDKADDDGEGEAVPAPEAPEHWSEADKSSFSELPDEAKPLYLDKVKSLESGFNRKFEELAQERKELEPYKGFHDLFKPFEQDLATAGITAEQYTRQLVATALQMRQSPEATLTALAQSHGVDLNSVGKPNGASADDEFTDPAISALRQENAALRQHVQGLSTKIDQSQIQARQASDDSVLKEWAIFTQSKDEQGNELHPHAEALRALVGDELTRNPPALAETTQQALKRAYETVRWLNSDIRSSLVKSEADKARREAEEAAKKAADAVKSEAQRKADVDKAKKAGRTVKSKSAPVDEAPAESKTWKEEVERQWDEAAAV